MLNKLLFASLLTLSTTTTTLVVADAPTKAPTKAPLPVKPSTACLVTMEATTPVFQIERKRNARDIDGEAVGTTLAIVSNGAWSYTETKLKTKTVVSSKAGCLSSGDLATLKASLAKATWKTTKAAATCEIYALDFIEYSYLGKPVLTSRMCDGIVLDAATKQALADATSITSKLLPTKPTTPPAPPTKK